LLPSPGLNRIDLMPAEGLQTDPTAGGAPEGRRRPSEPHPL